jgi:hypothetical protein
MSGARLCLKLTTSQEINSFSVNTANCTVQAVDIQLDEKFPVLMQPEGSAAKSQK